MNCCGAEAAWIVVGAAVKRDTGEAVTVVLGACQRHVLPIKRWVDDQSALLGEEAVVLGRETFEADVRNQLGLEVQTLVAAAS